MKYVLSLLIVVLLFGSGAMAEAQSSPDPLHTIDIDGRQQFISCLGKGSPTIIIDAGMGEWSLHWLGIQSHLSQTTRTCVYDRAGYGYSDMSESPRTGEQIVAELHALLAAAEVEPPYLLVGHSLGGVHMRLYTHQYSDEVVGLVLIDSTPSDVSLPTEMQQLMAESYAQFPQLADLAAQGAIKPEQMPVPAYLPTDLTAQYQQQVATEGFFTTLYGEYNALPETMQAVDEAADLGDLPLTVIAARLADEGYPPDLLPTMERYQAEDWLPAQERLTQLSSNSQIIIADHSHHHIQFDEPDVIIEGVNVLFHSITDQVMPF
ncbi:MAG: alpha/beta hydrolase [Anaerolineae bacterium]|nr:alpha/beta hydrolase [Anaerolineae bacterium]